MIDGIPVVTGYYRSIVEEEFPLSMDPSLRESEALKTDDLANNAMISAARNNGESVWA